MGKFVKGDVVVVPFPFSDLSQSKRRPALVLANLTGDDVILCQITSKAVRDAYALDLTGKDFAVGSLQQDSNIRPNRVFTADSKTILHRAGALKTVKLQEVVTKLIEILNA